MFKASRIYVAGHTGLLGSALVRRLGAQGYSNIIAAGHEELDLTVQEAVWGFFKRERPEYVFLAAGLTGGIMANRARPAEFLHVNIAIQDNVFEASRAAHVKRLVFYGSSCIYPKKAAQPMKEEYLLTGEIEESSEAYAIAKIAGIKACRACNIEDGANRFIALVPNSIYGPNDNFDLENSHVLSAMIRKISDAKREGRERLTLWGSGTPKREFLFSEDAADASIFAMLNADSLENTFYNVGSGAEYSIKELAAAVSRIMDYKGRIEWDTSKPDGAPRKLLDSTRFKGLGWRAKTPPEDGLKTTYQWYQRSLCANTEAI